jgi:hypothetical protein
MATLHAPVGSIKLPDSCASCGDRAAASLALRAHAGVELLVVGKSGRCEVKMPVCARCHERLTLLRGLRWAAIGLAGLAAIVAGAVALDLLVPVVPALREAVALLTALCLVAGLTLVLLLAQNRPRLWFERRWLPAWIEAFDGTSATLGARHPETLARLVSASGLPGTGLAGAGLGGGAAYRAPALATDAHAPRATRVPAWALIAVAPAIALAGYAEYASLRAAERRGGSVSAHWLEIAIYRVAGAPGVLVLFLAVAVLLLAGGVAMLRRQQRRVA